MKTIVTLGAVMILGGLIHSVPGWSQGTAPQVSVSTLPLTVKMPSWGRLGGVATESSGYIYVANFGSTVWQVSPTGDVREISNSMYGASGNAIDKHGDLIQANHFDGRLHRISRDGTVSLLVDGELQGPVGVAINKAGEIFVTNCWAENIAKVATDNSVSIFSSDANYSCPNGLAFDKQDNLYVVNFSNTVITRIAPDGTASTLATLPGVGNGHIAYFNNFFYVTQFLQHRIYRVGMNGDYELIAGTGESKNQDGPGLRASLAWPNGIAVSGGNLYINTLDGKWRDRSIAGQMLVRVIELPTLFRTLEAALEHEDDQTLRIALDSYLSEYNPTLPKEAVLGSLDGAATRLLARGEPENAVRVARLATQLDSNSPTGWLALGDVYNQLDDMERAKMYYTKALELEPDNVTIRIRLDSLGQ
jgi:sugar lactone lactonase YvrE